MALKNRFRELLAEKQYKEERRLTPTIMAEEADIAYTTAQRWMDGDVTRYDDDILQKICEWMPCTPGELLDYSPPPSRQDGTETAPTSAQIVAQS